MCVTIVVPPSLIVTTSPVIGIWPKLTSTLGVVALVILSVDELPLSEAATRSRVGAGILAADTVIENVELVSETPFASVTTSASPDAVCAVVGVPLMMPVELLTDRPEGSEPVTE